MNEVAFRKIIFKVTGKEPTTVTGNTQRPGSIADNTDGSSFSELSPVAHGLRESPAPYFLVEILSLHKLSLDERREMHRAKLAYGDVRLWQDG